VIEEKELTESAETEEHPHKWVYLFDEGSGDNKSLFGGKGAGVRSLSAADSSVRACRVECPLLIAGRSADTVSERDEFETCVDVLEWRQR